MNVKTLFLLALTALAVPAAFAQKRAAAPVTNTIPCGAYITDAPLQSPPEIRSAGGILSGTLYTVSEQVKMTVATAGPGSAPNCFPQWVRAYRRDAPKDWNPSSQQLLDPMPGPTLRARLGDIVELTFFNSIDASKFPNADKGCEQNANYPGTTGDKYPDCFAGSVFTNVHYHGTHTNPNTTGDNVFLNIRPSPRRHDGTNVPVINEASVRDQFATFFAACEQQLQLDRGPKIWPRRWSDLPTALQESLMDQVKQYGVPGWYEANQNLIANGNWPQYYVGAYPYCFRLPQYSAAATPAVTPAAQSPHSHGAGTAEVDEAKAPTRPLIMGQSPGTHWYHAHKHGSTTINVMNGMTGAFIIEGAYDDAIRSYYRNAKSPITERVLVVQQLGSLPPLSIGQPGGPGPDFSINGQLRPTIAMKGNEVQMWRIANTSGRAGIYFVKPPTKTLQWRQLAQDGVQFSPANYAASTNLNREFLLASGNRADLLVKAPPYDPAKGKVNKYTVQVYNTVDPSDRPPQKPAVPSFTLLTVEITGNNATDMQFIPEDQAPQFLPFLADIEERELSGTKIIKFASTPILAGPPAQPAPNHTIDGKKFDGELGVVVELNRAEEWKIVNETYGPATGNQISHPFHIHINPFQVTEVFDPYEALSITPGGGKVTALENTSTVTGEGTAFDADFRPGDFIYIDNSNTGNGALQPATVLSIEGPSSLTVDIVVPKGKGAAGSPYSVAIPRYTIDSTTARTGQCLISPTDPSTWKPCNSTEPANGRIWWDVFSIPSGRRFPDGPGKTVSIPGHFKMRSRFVDYSGYYVIHCHILAHEDRGMMTVVGVAPLQTPYSHH